MSLIADILLGFVMIVIIVTAIAEPVVSLNYAKAFRQSVVNIFNWIGKMIVGIYHSISQKNTTVTK